MYRKIILFFIVACFQVIACAQSSVKENLEPTDFQKKLKATDQAILIDVRTPAEVQQGKIPGAVPIDFNSPDFKGKISKLDKNKPYFVYCAAGGRSSKAANLMEELGFKKVYNLSGGITAWQDEGLPVEKK
jgi:rhodanese-related sulfurtransferase